MERGTSAMMSLLQPRIQGADTSIPLVDAIISSIYRDKRTKDQAVSDQFRRRKPPAGLNDLIGTGRIWVVRGEFSVLKRELAAWNKPGEMRLLGSNMIFHVVKLEVLNEPDTAIARWGFSSLSVPTPAQLEKMQTEIEAGFIFEFDDP
jgi:hypothetical protein